ncbi:MAG: FecR family protein [Deltaproteobacteria bacterium]|nr:FecR family protein [Deltaproteobacteria bacterium]
MAIGGFRFAAAVLFLSVLAVIFSPASSQAKIKNTVIGKFISIKNNAEVGMLGSFRTEAVSRGADLRVGDNIKTKKGDIALIELEDGTRVALFENTTARVSGFVLDTSVGERKVAITLFKGKISVFIMKRGAVDSENKRKTWTNSLVRVETNTSIVKTKDATFAVEIDADNVTILSVGSGEVLFRNAKRSVHGEMKVVANQVSKVLKYDPPTVPKEVEDYKMEDILGGLFVGFVDDDEVEEVIIDGKKKAFNPLPVKEKKKEEEGAWQKPAGGEAIPAEMEPSVEPITIGEPDPSEKDLPAEGAVVKEGAASEGEALKDAEEKAPEKTAAPAEDAPSSIEEALPVLKED